MSPEMIRQVNIKVILIKQKYELYSPLPIEMIDVNQAHRSITNSAKAGVLRT
jgi:hypothetical protein